MTPLDRAAKAAAEYYGEDWEKLPEENPVANGELDRAHFRETARAMLQAVREPSEGMLLAALAASNEPDGLELSKRDWQAMIDAALAEGPDDFIPIPRLR